MNVACVKEITKLSDELKKQGYFLNELIPLPVTGDIAKKYHHIIEVTDLLRPIAACEVDPSYALAPNSKFDEEVYTKVFSGRAVEEYLTFYWLWKTLSLIAESKTEKHAKGLALHVAWMHLQPLLSRLDLMVEVRLLAESHFDGPFERKFQLLKSALSCTLEITVDFYKSRKDKKTDSLTFFVQPHLERDFLYYLLDRKEDLSAIRGALDHFVKAISYR